ncbi:hypothetical protein SLU01_12060 [Sporosarcina luteola]|uniref:Uncharacterized protein n=1 Tax=Sporosarcina luteola TaxID=582850 RepID=A0A511Z646_9BACL|nr:hypothetical protein SLU01_12060 [Sporosarcina luteola]
MFTVAIGVLAELYDIRFIYIIGSFAFLILGIIMNVIVLDKTKKTYYNGEEESHTDYCIQLLHKETVCVYGN